ncbi:hypothetical protein DYBT9275_01310 [Dyadobacter sp. CECT 9275]|uniref:Uncharacterized protein n=1 Tax=Dyadobacter helix TaxID=2822344 RepID=A0A916J9Z6_9BACT|nr:hypothetical protein DYBT9275_01310 [Dyadobacter sp. CECT 9275]
MVGVQMPNEFIISLALIVVLNNLSVINIVHLKVPEKGRVVITGRPARFRLQHSYLGITDVLTNQKQVTYFFDPPNNRSVNY